MTTHLALLFALSLDSNPSSDAHLHLSKGDNHFQCGRLATAEAEYREAVRILENTPSAELALALNNLGTTLAGRHEYERALPVLRRANRMAQQFLTSEQRFQIQGNTAQVMIRLGDYSAARPLVDQVVSFAEAANQPYLLYALLSRAAIFTAALDWDGAQKDIDRVLQSIDNHHPLAPNAHALRATAWQRAGNHRLAVNEFAIALELGDRTPYWIHTSDATDIIDSYSVSLRKTGQRRRAKALVQEVNNRKRINPTP